MLSSFDKKIQWIILKKVENKKKISNKIKINRHSLCQEKSEEVGSETENKKIIK